MPSYRYTIFVLAWLYVNGPLHAQDQPSTLKNVINSTEKLPIRSTGAAYARFEGNDSTERTLWRLLQKPVMVLTFSPACPRSLLYSPSVVPRRPGRQWGGAGKELRTHPGPIEAADLPAVRILILSMLISILTAHLSTAGYARCRLVRFPAAWA